MEQNFFRDGFENLLKEQADNFRMYPSRRVWNSIYNDLYPGRRWPSMTVMLLLIFSLVYIGITHSHQVVGKADQSAIAGKKAGTDGKITVAQQSLHLNKLINEPSASGFAPSLNNSPSSSIVSNNRVADNNADASGSFVQRGRRLSSGNAERLRMQISSSVAEVEPSANNTADESIIINDLESSVTVNSNQTDVTFSEVDAVLSLSSVQAEKQTTASRSTELKLISIQSIQNLPKDNTEKEWMEDFAFHNKPRSKKWTTSVDYMAWITPSVGYRSLKANRKYEPAARIALLAPLGNGEVEPELVHNPAVNFEAGVAARFHKSKNLIVKLGVQFNYTNYTVRAYELNHTTSTSLMLNDINTGTPYLVSRPSSLANIEGLASQHVNNNSYQFSVPIGLDFRLAGIKKIKWYAGASVQPGFVFGGQSLLISADKKNYISDNSFRRKWNLNSGFESYVTYQTPSGLTVMAGPQIRYQLFSTYSGQYSYKENLYNLGLKIGVIKKF